MRRQELADDLTVISDEHIEERLAVKICCGGSNMGALLDPHHGFIYPFVRTENSICSIFWFRFSPSAHACVDVQQR